MQEERETLFNDLVQRHKDLLWHICQDYRLSTAWTTEDALQEVLCNIWKDLDTFKHQSAERTWVYRIAINTMLSLKRKQSNQPATNGEAKSLATYMPSDLRDLERLIAALGEPDTTIVRASLDGFDYAEIAEITHLSVGAVGMRLSRAKTKLKNQLSHE